MIFVAEQKERKIMTRTEKFKELHEEIEKYNAEQRRQESEKVFKNVLFKDTEEAMRKLFKSGVKDAYR